MLYKDLTDFDPKEIIRKMKRSFFLLNNAVDNIVAIDIEKNGLGERSKNPNLI